MALGQLADRRGEAELAQRVRLDPADDLAQVDARLARHHERSLDDRCSARDVTGRERVLRGVEHLGDRGDELNGAVVDQLGEPPSLVALGAKPLGERPAVGVVVGQSIIASRSAIATACVRVSASSFVRMWRTWLLTVSCEMNSWAGHVGVRHAVGEELQDLALARGEHVGAVAGLGQRRHQRGVDERLARCDLLDRAQQRLVRRLLEDVATGAGLETALKQRALGVGGEDQDLGVGDAAHDLLGRLDPVHAGHPQVHHDHVGAAALGERDGGLAVGGLADDADVGRAEERKPKALADDLVVVGEEDGDLGCFGHAAILRGPSDERELCRSRLAAGAQACRRSHAARASAPTRVRTGAVSLAGR